MEFQMAGIAALIFFMEYILEKCYGKKRKE